MRTWIRIHHASDAEMRPSGGAPHGGASSSFGSGFAAASGPANGAAGSQPVHFEMNTESGPDLSGFEGNLAGFFDSAAFGGSMFSGARDSAALQAERRAQELEDRQTAMEVER